MIRTIKYTLLRLLRDKNELFWILLFPIVLGSLFKASFSSLMDAETFEPIPVAVVNENEDAFATFGEVLDALSEEGDGQMLTATYCSGEDALKLFGKSGSGRHSYGKGKGGINRICQYGQRHH